MLIDANMRAHQDTDGVIYVTLTSNGLTGPEWSRYLQSIGFGVAPEYDTDKILDSPEFVPIPSGTELDIAILSDTFCSEEELSWVRIHKEATHRGWVKGPAEVACILRKEISNDEMRVLGLCYIVAVHEPIQGKLLQSSWRDGGRLTTFDENDNPRVSRLWGRNRGYAFLVPRTK